MAIVPENLSPILQTHLAILQSWFSDQLLAHIVKNAPHHLFVQLRSQLDLSEIERACRGYHHLAGPGVKARHPVACLVRALLVKWVYNLSLRETEERLRHDLVVKWFVGYGVFAEVPDHATLERFEQWVSREAHRVFFDEVLKQIDAARPQERGGIQIGDTFAMQADAALEGSVELLRHTCRLLLNEVKTRVPAAYDQLLQAVDLTLLLGPVDEAPGFTLEAEARQQRRLQTVQGIWQLRAALAPLLPHWERDVQLRVGIRLEDVEKILTDEFKIVCDAAGQPVSVSGLAPKDKGSYRLGSATDPEATCRHHGGDLTLGYNVSLAVNPHGFIREIQAATGSEPDQAGVAPLIAAQLEHQGFCPDKLIYDQAAGAGRTRAAVATVSAGRTQLVARIPPASVQGRFGPEAFHFNPEGALVCPHGRSTTSHFRAPGDAEQYEFRAKVCAGCPLWEHCREPHAKPTGPRRVYISDYQNEIAQAQSYNQTARFQQEMKQRPWVERVIFMLTHYDGARRARSRGKARADFQAKMSATARNLRTWIHLSLREKAEGRIKAASVA